MADIGLEEIFQYAYKPGHSTETALLRVSVDVLRGADNYQVTLLNLLDLGMMFDTVDHAQFTERMENDYGVTGDMR